MLMREVYCFLRQYAGLAFYYIVGYPYAFIIFPILLFFDERRAWKDYKNIPQNSPNWRKF